MKIVDTRSKMAVAHVEFGCDTVLPGDYAIPFVEKTAIASHPPMRFDRFAPANGQVNGRIILAKDFDSEMGNGGKVYLNIGANQGLKVGDYLRAVRSYETTARDAVESLSFKSPALEPTQTLVEAGDFTDQRLSTDPFAASGAGPSSDDDSVSEGSESYVSEGGEPFVPPIDPVGSSGEVVGGLFGLFGGFQSAMVLARPERSMA